jgi:hypothetical protein
MIALVALWFATPTIALAQDQDQPRESGKVMRQAPRKGGGKYLERIIERVREQLDLDEEQKVEFDRIATEFLEKRRGGGAQTKRLRELTREMRQAHKDGDRERAAEIRKQLAEMRGTSPLQGLFDEVEKILRDDQREKLAEIRERFTPSAHRARGNPLVQLRRLRTELELSEEQAAQYDALYAELEKNVKQRPGGGPEMERLLQEIMKAAEEGDTERIKELREQLPDPRRHTQEVVAQFLDDVEQLLEPEQVKVLQRFRRQMQTTGRQTELRNYFRIVRRLELDQQQREQLRELERETMRAAREFRRDPEALAELESSVQKELRDLLTDEQCAEFDRWLERAQSGKRWGRDRGDRPRRQHGRQRPAETEPEEKP